MIVAVPFFLAVTFPEEDTTATAELLEDQVRVLFSAFEGLTVALSVTEEPTSSFFDLRLDVTETG